mmetsp:Transcript_27207/g.93994  ORF Transcript_27207/g.93994 Transcript_27207/m.93994 type:complete len:83 (+) Transcript_27207:1910-2158(+)
MPRFLRHGRVAAYQKIAMLRTRFVVERALGHAAAAEDHMRRTIKSEIEHLAADCDNIYAAVVGEEVCECLNVCAARQTHVLC